MSEELTVNALLNGTDERLRLLAAVSKLLLCHVKTQELFAKMMKGLRMFSENRKADTSYTGFEASTEFTFTLENSITFTGIVGVLDTICRDIGMDTLDKARSCLVNETCTRHLDKDASDILLALITREE